jgi:hypothetical protein
MIRARVARAAGAILSRFHRPQPAPVEVPKAKPISTITIEVFGPSDFDVRHGGQIADRLNWEELLGQIATLTHPKILAPRFATRPESEPPRWPRIPDEDRPA